MKCTTAKRIKQIVALAAEVAVIDLISARRQRRIVEARHVAMWLMRRYTPLSHPQIAQALGRSDHSTAMHGVRKVEQALECARRGEDDQLAALAWRCEALLVSELSDREKREAFRRDMERRMPSGWGWREYLAEQARRNRQRRLIFLRMQMEARRVMRYRLPLPPIRRLRFRPLRPPGRPRPHERPQRYEHERFDRQAFLNSLRIHPEKEIAK